MNSYLNSFGKQTFPSIFDLSSTPTINPYYPVVPTDPSEVKNLLSNAEKDLARKEDLLKMNRNILNDHKRFREDYPLLSTYNTDYHKENSFSGMSLILEENLIRAEKDVNYAKAEVERLSKLLDGAPKLFSSSSEKKSKPSSDHAKKEILRNPIETVNSSKMDSQKRSLDSMNMTYLPFENRTFSGLPTSSRSINLNNDYRFPPIPKMDLNYPIEPTDPYSEVKTLLKNAEKDLSRKENTLALRKIEVANAKDLLEMDRKSLNDKKRSREDHPLLSNYHKVLENSWKDNVSSAERSLAFKENALICAEDDVNCAKAKVERLSKLLDGTPRLFSSSSEKKPKPSSDHAKKEILQNPIETVNSSKMGSHSMNLTYLPLENRPFSRIPNIDLNNPYCFPPIPHMDLNNTFNIPPIPKVDLNYPIKPTDTYSKVKKLLMNAEKDLYCKESTLTLRKIEVAKAKDLLEMDRKILNDRKRFREDHPILSNCNTEHYYKVLENSWKENVSSAERSLILKENALICAEEDVNCAKAKVEMCSKLLADTAKLFSSSSEKKLQASSNHARKEILRNPILDSQKPSLNSMNMTYLPFEEQTYPPVPFYLNNPFHFLPMPKMDQNYPTVPIDPLSGRKLFCAEKDLIREEDSLIRRKIDDDTKAIIEFNRKILNDEKRLRGDLPSSTDHKVLENSLKENALIKAKKGVDDAKALVEIRSKFLDDTAKWFSSSSKKVMQTGDKEKCLHLRYICLVWFIGFCLLFAYVL